MERYRTLESEIKSATRETCSVGVSRGKSRFEILASIRGKETRVKLRRHRVCGGGYVNSVGDDAGGTSAGERNRKKRRTDYLDDDGITRR